MGQWESRLEYDEEIDRFKIDGYGLHCWERIEILFNGSWIETRVEVDWSKYDCKDKWYLVGLKGLEFEGIKVKMK